MALKNLAIEKEQEYKDKIKNYIDQISKRIEFAKAIAELQPAQKYNGKLCDPRSLIKIERYLIDRLPNVAKVDFVTQRYGNDEGNVMVKITYTDTDVAMIDNTCIPTIKSGSKWVFNFSDSRVRIVWELQDVQKAWQTFLEDYDTHKEQYTNAINTLNEYYVGIGADLTITQAPPSFLPDMK